MVDLHILMFFYKKTKQKFIKLLKSKIVKVFVFIHRTNLKNATKFIVEFDAHLPFMNVKAEYAMSGNVIRIPVKMNGNIDLDFGKQLELP